MADGEAIVDRAVSVEPLVSCQQQGETSSPSLVDPSPKGNMKRWGRGLFLYQKSCLYSDQHDVGTKNGDNPVAVEEVKVRDRRLEDADDQEWNTTHTGDLEKLLGKFRDHGFAVLWGRCCPIFVSIVAYQRGLDTHGTTVMIKSQTQGLVIAGC